MTGFGPSDLSLFVLAFTLPPLLIVLILVFIVRSSRGPAPLSLEPGRPISLYARVMRPEQSVSIRGQFDSQLYGRLTIRDRQLFWDPEVGERWATPLTAVTVLSTGGAMALPGPHLDIEIAGSGRWRLVVSDRTINRFMTNDFKRFREARRARDLADHLVRSGARSAS